MLDAMDPDPELEDDELEAANEDGCDMLEEADCGHGRLQFRGDGNREAEQMLSELLAKPALPQVKPIYEEKAERMSDGTIFRTVRQVNFMPSRSVDGGKP